MNGIPSIVRRGGTHDTPPPRSTETGNQLNTWNEWGSWPQTHKTLLTTYYPNGLDKMDSSYALAGLTRYAQLWNEEHAHRNIPLQILDAAAAHEVWYQHVRARLFRRPVAALSACWVSLICERPERILDRWDRAQIATTKRTQGARARAG